MTKNKGYGSMPYTYKENRYITLLGDDIESSRARAYMESKGTFATGVATLHEIFAGASNPESLLTPSIITLINNGFDIILFREFLERLILNQFTPGQLLITQKKLNEICINKDPTKEDVQSSLKQYGDAIENAKRWYGFMLFFSSMTPALNLASVFTPGSEAELRLFTYSLAQNAGGLTRAADGFHRFNQLSKGQTAIVRTPQEQQTREKDIPFTFLFDKAEEAPKEDPPEPRDP